MKDILLVLLMVAGGLGVFLLGMKHLSEGWQAVSGNGLRRFMALATSHRLAGVATGVVSTVIVQSSSIITVMVVGFVSTSLLTLTQAINVIIGANIGTTATVWIIAYVPSVELLGLGGIAVGGLLYFFVHKERFHNLGLALLGLGLIFLGLYFMNKGVEPIKNHEGVKAVFEAMDAKTFLGVAKVALAALVFTAVIQSSAASIAIAMTLAQQGLISYETAVASLCGANIGTTMTAWLAAIGSTTDAKRAALAHTLFNVIGTVVLLPFVLPFVVPLGQHFFPNWGRAVVAPDGSTLFPSIMLPIAATDTFFSIARAVLILPFVGPFAKLIAWLVPARVKEVPRLTYLNPHVKQSPVIACDQASREVAFMADSDLELLAAVRRVVAGETDDELEEHIFHRENILDSMQREITDFLGHVMTGRMPQDVANRARMLLRATDEFESVSDECAAVLKMMRRMRTNSLSLTPAGHAELLRVHDLVAAFGARVSAAFKQSESVNLADALQNLKADSDNIKALIRDTRAAHLARLETAAA